MDDGSYAHGSLKSLRDILQYCNEKSVVHIHAPFIKKLLQEYDELKQALEDIADMSPCSAELEAAFYARQVLKLAPYADKAVEGK